MHHRPIDQARHGVRKMKEGSYLVDYTGKGQGEVQVQSTRGNGNIEGREGREL
jgi:hypothetical protein